MMNDSVNSLVDFTVAAFEIHCRKVVFSIALSVNTPNVFYKSVGLQLSLQSHRKEFKVDCKL
jgi:hypothetical protein